MKSALTDEALGVATLYRKPGWSDPVAFAVMVGCAAHGNRFMDWDERGAFCHACAAERAA